jgi:hypothetical protein
VLAEAGFAVAILKANSLFSILILLLVNIRHALKAELAGWG